MNGAKLTRKELLRYARASQLGRPSFFGRDPANPRRWLVSWGSSRAGVSYRAATLHALASQIYVRAYKHLPSPAQQLADRDIMRLVGRAKHSANVHQPALLRRLEVSHG